MPGKLEASLTLVALATSSLRLCEAEDLRVRDTQTGRTIAFYHDGDASGALQSSGGAPNLARAEDVPKFASELLAKEGYSVTSTDLTTERAFSDERGTTWVLAQFRRGLPVFGSRVTVRSQEGSVSISLTAQVSDAPLKAEAQIGSDDARALALSRLPAGSTVVSATETVIDASVLGAPRSSAAAPGWFVVTEDPEHVSRHAFLVDGAGGAPVLDWSLAHDLTERYVYDCSFGGGLCALDAPMSSLGYTFGRSEGQPTRGDCPLVTDYKSDLDSTYDRLGYLRDYYDAMFGRDGADNAGGLSGRVAGGRERP
jgi:Zn-dependent metalloprotease